MHAHLKDRRYYEDIYDRVTISIARRNVGSFEKFRERWFEIMPDEKPDSTRSVFSLNWIYMLMAGSKLVERYDGRESGIKEMMDKDSLKDEQVANARLTVEPKCQHCGKTGLRITDKMLHHSKGFDDPTEVLFMLKCTHCNKNSAVWEDGEPLKHHETLCPKCNNIMAEKDTRKDKVITTTYTCPSCKHTYKSKLDLNTKEEEVDPDFERDRVIYCLQDEKMLQEHRDAKWRLEGMVQMGKELKEKEDNKELYEAVSSVKKVNIGQLTDTLEPAIKKADYIELTFEKPEIGKDVIVGFSCLDGKSNRAEHDSNKTLQKTVKKALSDTNWRLMSDGISYRLGYLSGRLRAYEREEDLLSLIERDKKIKRKPTMQC